MTFIISNMSSQRDYRKLLRLQKIALLFGINCTEINQFRWIFFYILLQLVTSLLMVALSDLLQGCSITSLIQSWYNKNVTRLTTQGCNMFYYMAFQNSLFWLVDKQSVKTHIRTVVPIFRIWTGVPDVVYLAGSGGKFLLCKQKKILLFNFPIVCH